TGEVLAGPVFDEETELYAELDMDLLKQANLDFDVYGHYSRPDIFSLHVDTRAKQVVKLQTEDSAEQNQPTPAPKNRPHRAINVMGPELLLSLAQAAACTCPCLS